ncbi:VCBS repeat-containing protein [bacterium]|nr:VCBS repeat-containing protein [bacterium]
MNKHIMGTVLFALCILAPLNSMADSGDSASLIWKLSADLGVTAIAPAGDLDGDGIKDIFMGSADNLVYCLSGSGIRQGEIIWSWNFGAPVWTVAAISDINGDGADDCLVGCADNTIYCMSGKTAGGLSEILWSYGVDGDIFTIAVLNDLTGDGIEDCVMGTNDDQVCCLEGKYGQVLWSYRDPDAGAIKSVVAISDVDKDGLDDCLAGGENDKVLCLSGGGSGSGRLIWYCDTQSTVLSVAAIQDVTGDGKPDCLAGGEDDHIYCISGSASGKNDPVWTYQTGSTVKSVSPIADVNQDGVADCLAGSQDDHVYCLSGKTGGVLWPFTTASTVLSVSSIADVNNSGVCDCIVGCENDLIYCIEGTQGAVIWSYATGGAVNCVLAVADLNGNQTDDVLGGSTDSYVYALDGGYIIAETVRTPAVPALPAGEPLTGTIDDPITFITGGSACNLGHPVEYRFDWDDGLISDWGDSSRIHVWTAYGSFDIKAQARCAVDTTILSAWSDYAAMEIIDPSYVNRRTAEEAPDRFHLDQNYPNPFNMKTTIEFQVPAACQVTIHITNILGNRIATLVDEYLQAGNYMMDWDGRAASGAVVPSGFYYCCMKAGEYISVKEMLVVK